jgi:hypothetical protein
VLSILDPVIKPVTDAVAQVANGDGGEALGGLGSILGTLGIDTSDVTSYLGGSDLGGLSNISDLVGRFGDQASSFVQGLDESSAKDLLGQLLGGDATAAPTSAVTAATGAATSAADEIRTAVTDTAADLGDDLLGASSLSTPATQAAAQAVADTAGDDLLGVSAPAATAVPDDAMIEVPAVMTAAVQPDTTPTDLGLPDPAAPAAEATPQMDDIAPATPIEAPADEFDQAIAAADQVESSVDDLFEGA